MDEQTIKRFWEKVYISDDCWVWTASTRSKGYGAFCWRDGNGKSVNGRAHRFSYELEHGPIPEGLFVLHKCDVPACVNPDHLFLGTNMENVMDMMEKGRHRSGGADCGKDGKWRRGADHGNAVLTPESVKKIREMHGIDGWSYTKLGREFNVNMSTIAAIITRRNWKCI